MITATLSHQVALLLFASLWLVAAATGKKQLQWRERKPRRRRRRPWRPAH